MVDFISTIDIIDIDRRYPANTFKEMILMVFTEKAIENIMENVEMTRQELSYFEGYDGSYCEPPEPEQVSLDFRLEYEGITPKQAERIEELKKDKYFIEYIEIYAQEILKNKLYNEELDYWEMFPQKDEIELKIEDNKLIIEVYIIRN